MILRIQVSFKKKDWRENRKNHQPNANELLNLIGAGKNDRKPAPGGDKCINFFLSNRQEIPVEKFKTCPYMPNGGGYGVQDIFAL